MSSDPISITEMFKLTTIEASVMPFLMFFKIKKILKINLTIIEDSVNFIRCQIKVITDASSRSTLVDLNEDSKITIHYYVRPLTHDFTILYLGLVKTRVRRVNSSSKNITQNWSRQICKKRFFI